LTFAVTTPSSIAWPVDCCVGVDEQATTVEAMIAANNNAAVVCRAIFPRS
jgi:hypothetical protein